MEEKSMDKAFKRSPKIKMCIYPPHHAEAYRTRYQVNYDVSQQIPIPQNSLLIHFLPEGHFGNKKRARLGHLVACALHVRTI